jgi:hypothetical protein
VDAPSLYPNDESGYVKLRYNSAGSTSNHTETFRSARRSAGARRECPGGDGHGLLSIRAPALGRQRSGHAARVHAQRLGHARHDQLPVGRVALTSWTAGATNAITRASCVTTVGENISSEYVFRTGAAPLRPDRCPSSTPARWVARRP